MEMQFCSKKILRIRLKTIFIIPRKKVLIPRHSKFRGRVSSKARNRTLFLGNFCFTKQPKELNKMICSYMKMCILLRLEI
jgi:hypothetical protein